jgi:ankyrin repeat protein
MASTNNNKRPREEDEEQHDELSVRRARSLEEEQPCAKMARSNSDELHQEGIIHNTASWPTTSGVDTPRPAIEEDDSKKAPRMPYAPTIGDFYAPGGSKRYLPRPEWLAKQQGRVARPRIRPHPRLDDFLLETQNFWNPLINELEENQEGGEDEEGPQDDVSSLGQASVHPSVNNEVMDNEFEGEEQSNDQEMGDLVHGVEVEGQEEQNNAEQMGDNVQGVEENDHAGGNSDGEDAAEADRPPPQNGLLPNDLFQEFSLPERPVESPLMSAAPEQQRAPPNFDLPVSIQNSTAQRRPRTQSDTMALETFGDDKNTALHICIREGAAEAALRLIELGADVNAHNRKGMTPLLSSCAKGQLEVLKALVRKGASVTHTASNGANALLQASHFGHLPVVEYLLSLREGRRLISRGNNNNTTALMRASQEGHLKICSLLLQQGAEVNRGNREAMNALMLASQRGHSAVVRLLVQYGARLNEKTSTESTALSLACKRGNLSVAKILVGAGCELRHRDNRARTAMHIAIRRLRHAEQNGEATQEASELLRILSPESQVTLMRQAERCDRSFVMVKLWTLLQQERAFFGDVSIHEVAERRDIWEEISKSTSALLATMTLPEPMVELIASFLPLSDLWDRRLGMLASQCRVDADMAVHSILDLIDECLDAGGFVEACATASVTAPTNFASWVS